VTFRDITQSIAVRLSALFALASAVILAAFGFYLNSSLENAIAMRQQAPLSAMAGIVRNMMDDIPSLERLRERPDIVGHLLAGNPRMRLWIYTEDGDILFASSAMRVPRPQWERIAPTQINDIATALWTSGQSRDYRLGVTRYSSARADIGRGVIVLALDVTEPRQILAAFKASMLVAVPAAMISVALIGIFVVRRGLRPIARVAKSTRRVTLSRLNERLDLPDMPPELRPLAESFNAMLARLEDSFGRLSDFSADLAHELRTPLASLLGRTQVMLSQKRSADEYRQAMELSVEEIQRLSSIISDMLFLAQADHAPAALTREELDLRSEVDRLIEFLGMTAEERGIVLEATGNATVYADRAMLGRAISNLISNAIRHSPDGERIDVAIERNESGVVVSVTDRGPGIPPEHLGRIFARFYRADPSRARTSGGTGLGLAIVRSIMTMHGGDVSVESEPGRSTVFSLNVPDPVRERGTARTPEGAGGERVPSHVVAHEASGSAS